MLLFLLQPAVMPIFLFGLLSIPSITPHTASSDGISQTFVKDQRSANNSGRLHSLTITGFSSKDSEENIILDSSEHLSLECILKADSMQIPNITWKHGEEEISRDLYKGNGTAGEWRTTLQVFVEDVNGTGSYACIFSTSTEAKATFHVKVPAIHGGGKTIVTYNGDYTVLKCDSYNYKPMEWLWYKVNGSEQVLLNGSRYKQISKKANETELHVSQLIAEDNGTYVCKAVFTTGYSEGQLHINVLSLMVPFRIFIAIVVEVVVLVAVILGYELVSKKKPTEEDVKSEDEQMTHLKTEENGTSEASSTRQRKV